jgi:acyl-CoA thioester hydrolase
MRELGLPYRKLEEAGFRLPVLEMSAKFIRPALYDDTIEIVTTLREKPLVRILLEYEALRGGELLATGTTLHAFVDRNGRPVRPPLWASQTLAKAFA